MESEDEIQVLEELSTVLNPIKTIKRELSDDAVHVVKRSRILLDKLQVPESSKTSKTVTETRPKSLTKPCHVVLDQIPIPVKTDPDSESSSKQDIEDPPNRRHSLSRVSKQPKEKPKPQPKTSRSRSKKKPVKKQNKSTGSRDSSVVAGSSRSSSVCSLPRPIRSRSPSVVANEKRVTTETDVQRSQKRSHDDSELDGESSSKRIKTSEDVETSIEELLAKCRPCSITLHRVKVPLKSTSDTSNKLSIYDQPSTSGIQKPKVKKSKSETMFSKNQRKKKEQQLMNKGKLIVSSGLFRFMKTKKSKGLSDFSDRNSEKSPPEVTKTSEIEPDILDDEDETERAENVSLNSNVTKTDKSVSLNSNITGNLGNNSDNNVLVNNNVAETDKNDSGNVETFFAKLQRERREREEKEKISRAGNGSSENNGDPSNEDPENNNDSGLESGNSNEDKELSTQEIYHSDSEPSSASKSFEEFASEFSKLNESVDNSLENSSGNMETKEKKISDGAVKTKENSKKSPLKDLTKPKSTTNENTSEIPPTKKTSENTTENNSNIGTEEDLENAAKMILESSETFSKRNDPTSSDLEVDPNIKYDDSLSDYLEIDQDMDFSDSESETTLYVNPALLTKNIEKAVSIMETIKEPDETPRADSDSDSNGSSDSDSSSKNSKSQTTKKKSKAPKKDTSNSKSLEKEIQTSKEKISKNPDKEAETSNEKSINPEQETSKLNSKNPEKEPVKEKSIKPVTKNSSKEVKSKKKKLQQPKPKSKASTNSSNQRNLSPVVIEIDEDHSDIEVECTKSRHSKLEKLKRQMKPCSVVLDRQEVTRYLEKTQRRSPRKPSIPPSNQYQKTLGIKLNLNAQISMLSCKICNVRFPTLNILRKHNAIIHKSEPFCVACSVYFETTTDYLVHEKRCIYAVGVQNTSMSDVIIDELSKTDVAVLKNNIRKKMNSVPVKNKIKLKTVAQINETVTSNDNDVEIITENISTNNPSGSYQCNDCNKYFDSKLNLARHVAIVHERKPYCKYCYLMFQNTFVQQDHMKVCTKFKQSNTNNPQSNSFTCFVCHKTYERKANLDSHFSNVHKGINCCHHCSVSFADEKEELDHIKICPNIYPEQLYNCIKCNTKVMCFNTYLKHIKYCAVVYCTLCNIPFKNSSLHDKHMFKKHATVVDVYSCKHCNLKFTQQKLLDVHITVQHAYKCGQCLQTFSTSVELGKHVTYYHERGVIKCNLCNKLFTTKRVLYDHQRRVHNMSTGRKGKTLICLDCNIVFQTRLTLRMHNTLCHSDNTKSKQCPKCSIRFANDHDLEIHMAKCIDITQLDKPNLQYCHKCSVGFSSVSDLNLHMDICLRANEENDDNDVIEDMPDNFNPLSLCETQLTPASFQDVFLQEMQLPSEDSTSNNDPLQLPIQMPVTAVQMPPVRTEQIPVQGIQMPPVTTGQMPVQGIQMPPFRIGQMPVGGIHMPPVRIGQMPLQGMQMPVQGIQMPVQGIQMPRQIMHAIRVQSVRPLQNAMPNPPFRLLRMPLQSVVQMALPPASSVQMPTQPIESVENEEISVQPAEYVEMPHVEDLETPEQIDIKFSIENNMTNEVCETEVTEISKPDKNTVSLLKCPSCSELFHGSTRFESLREHLCLASKISVKQYQVCVDLKSFEKLKERCKGYKLRLANKESEISSVNCVQCDFKCQFDCEMLKHQKLVHLV